MNYNFKLKSERLRFYRSTTWCGVNGVRNQVVKRDRNECVWCREKGLVTTTNLEVDHIIPVEDCTYEQAIDINNCRTLCRTCHNLRHERFEGKQSKSKWDDETW